MILLHWQICVTEEETVLEQGETVPEEANIHYCHLHLEIR